ncbi:MAG: BON domain-containing protein, partial [Chitinophagaceae bacterium]
MKLSLFLIIVVMMASCSPTSDKKLQQDVKIGLSILDSTINVSVTDGVVTLSGEVEDEAVKNASESSIEEVKGVKSVINDLRIKPALPDDDFSARPDTEIKEYVNAAFAANNIQGVTTTVQSGEVVLTG